eukprot:TRINITY_DN5850_c0_g1_i1.p1 TRINITY_DN5850_c0_g1~~TRINITY_DN5850_c0_g1_i1.p1  ORF type:complete len:439 (+),score=38.77 TRINITY_DN5850_c0_g1_i1:205-1521(+)
MRTFMRSGASLGALLLLVASSSAHPSNIPWDFVPSRTAEFCVAPDTPRSHSRLVHLALPNGDPPPGGWPVFVTFTVTPFASFRRLNCTGAPSRSYTKSYSPWATPRQIAAGCFGASGRWAEGTACSLAWDPTGGGVWQQRYKQLLLANGVALLIVPAMVPDDYDITEPRWSTGLDRPFMHTLLGMMAGGSDELGALSNRGVFLQGWSAGGHFVSWLIEQTMRGDLNMSIAGAVFMSGGSYACYQPPPLAINNCARCNTSCGWGVCPLSTMSSARCSSCGPSIHPSGVCCEWCCPHDFTEQYFVDYPQAYPRHPPAFLMQLSTYDVNADLCAARNYARTLQANGVEAVLVLEAEERERCYCVGQEDDLAAAGSPFVGVCTASIPNRSQTPEGCLGEHFEGKQEELCCLGHSMGFASMVDPLIRFVVEHNHAVKRSSHSK